MSLALATASAALRVEMEGGLADVACGKMNCSVHQVEINNRRGGGDPLALCLVPSAPLDLAAAFVR